MNALAPLDTMRVLVVDDDRDTTDCMSLLLKHLGHEAHVANDGGVAIEQAPRIRPDLMLVDLAMPKISGLQVAQQVRQAPELANTSLVALTGYGDAPHREEAMAAGFDECLTKPLPMDHLLALLQRVRGRVAASRERAALAVDISTRSQELKAKTIAESDVQGPVRPDATPVRIAKSGISDVVVLQDPETASHLRQWLRERGCRVGPVFHFSPGQAAFFNYSRRQLRMLLGNNPEYRIQQ
ncbi:MAG TPA: response regulator [Pirellulales bacterium]|nr:response regulator [Pirellulales bacterium]